MPLLYILFLLFNLINSYNIPLFLAKNEKTKVLLHLERFNERYNLLHIGISFSGKNKNIRYDFRPYSESVGYLTTTMDRREFSNIFPELDITNDFEEQYTRYRDAIIFDTQELYTKDIFWGFSNYTFDEIVEYEKTLHKKYRVGIYDCRHYVNHFTTWCLDKPTPVWTLHKLWDKY